MLDKVWAQCDDNTFIRATFSETEIPVLLIATMTARKACRLYKKDGLTMPGINSRDFIEELRFDIREKDMIKAKLVLAKIGAVDDGVRKMALFELNRADDMFAIPLIVNLVAEHRDLARQAVRESLARSGEDDPTGARLKWTQKNGRHTP